MDRDRDSPAGLDGLHLGQTFGRLRRTRHRTTLPCARFQPGCSFQRRMAAHLVLQRQSWRRSLAGYDRLWAGPGLFLTEHGRSALYPAQRHHIPLRVEAAGSWMRESVQDNAIESILSEPIFAYVSAGDKQFIATFDAAIGR